ncbi:MAG: CHAT domain-containing protein [Phaeodactylibacter sp.]|nr:CHAT domain-containing protein [Phaeodactylibacter sp.]
MELTFFGKPLKPHGKAGKPTDGHSTQRTESYSVSPTPGNGWAAIVLSLSDSDLIELQFEDDTIRFASPGELAELLQSERQPAGAPFELPPFIKSPGKGGKRVLIRKISIVRAQNKDGKKPDTGRSKNSPSFPEGKPGKPNARANETSGAFPQSPAGQSRGFEGIPSVHPKEEKEKTTLPLKVTVKNGHLKYARHPVVIGHFKGDGIISAEGDMDYLLKSKLSEREGLGLYPGPIGTNLVVLPDENNDLGTVIVGLGEPENLTPFILSKTIEAGCLEYLLRLREGHVRQPREKDVGITTLLVGSSYANLSLSNSINAILEGVSGANNKIQRLEENHVLISEVEFLELYQDKALNAFYLLGQIGKTSNTYNIKLEGPIREVDGKRTIIPIDNSREWWKRITATLRNDPETGRNYIDYSASTGRAKIDVRPLFVDQSILEALLADSQKEKSWNQELSRTMFELLVPNDYKIAFRDQQNLLLILDKYTAWYPWELLHYDSGQGAPVCVSTGMIRQLSTSNDRKKIKPVNNNRALIIGDPILSANTGIGQLPKAAEEAEAVNKLLKDNGFDPTTRIRQPFKEVITKLYDEYKIIHIASHGVIDYGPEKKSGILLSDDVVLTAAEIDQISSTPELAFINCCHLGEVDPGREKHFREKYRLAANIGTQLIENGVKAVVVAGWAVHDDAALLFAEEFYRQMLDGLPFGEAVKRARKACYEEHKNTNTWGAYQCYGDQFYQLVKKEGKKENDSPYILDKEILIDLENFINDARFAKTRDGDLTKRLKDITRRIDETKLRNGIVTEQEAMAYAEIEEYETAIAKYASLHEQDKANHSVRAIEQWCNLRAHQLVIDKKKEVQKDYLREMKAVITELGHLIRLGQTKERLSLLGSAYKRKAVLVENAGSKRNAIEDMANSYREAYLLNNKELNDKRVYQLTNWIVAEKILDKKDRTTEAESILKAPMETFLGHLLEELTNHSTDKKEFWDLIEIVNVNQCRLLFAKGAKAQNEIVNEIQSVYRKAWNIGGSYKQKNSEVAHMEFIRDGIEALWKRSKTLSASIDKLIGFFREPGGQGS